MFQKKWQELKIASTNESMESVEKRVVIYQSWSVKEEKLHIASKEAINLALKQKWNDHLFNIFFKIRNGGRYKIQGESEAAFY